jgi:hypothetical protein
LASIIWPAKVKVLRPGGVMLPGGGLRSIMAG